MLMAIDVGNTNMVFGLLDGERLVGSFRLMTDANRTSDEIGLTVCEYFRRFDLTMDQVTDIIIASVVPQVMYTLTSAIIKYFGKKPIIIDEDVSTGIRYQGDDRLGADRSVSCVAAMEKYGKPLVVLDFGTATTVVLGKNTIAQIQAGSVMGYIGAIEYLIRQTKAEMPGGENATVVATGGLARLIADNTDLIDVVDGQLILDGLRIIYERYQADKNK